MFQANLVKRAAVGVAVAFLAGTGMTMPAEARGIVADQDVPTSYHGGCALNKGTHCKPYLLQGHKFYIYTDGLVTVDTPLPVTTLAAITGSGGLANIKTMLGGARFVAIGLNDYSALKLKLRIDTVDPAISSGFTLSWSFSSGIAYPNKKVTREAVFGLTVDNSSGTSVKLTAGYAAFTPSWFSKKYRNVVVCNDADCNPADFPVVGDYLPPNSVVGSDMSGTVLDTNKPYTSNTNLFGSSFKYPSIAFPAFQ